jgi:hypothetical protein
MNYKLSEKLLESVHDKKGCMFKSQEIEAKQGFMHVKYTHPKYNEREVKNKPNVYKFSSSFVDPVAEANFSEFTFNLKGTKSKKFLKALVPPENKSFGIKVLTFKCLNSQQRTVVKTI